MYESHRYRFIGCDEHGPDHVVHEMQRWGKLYSQDALETLRQVRRERAADGAWVDVGANIGVFSIYFANHCAAEHVYAYEFNPGTFAALQANVAANALEPRRITLVNKAVFSRRARVGMELWVPGNNATCRIQGEIEDGQGGVEAVTLDESLAGATIAMIKLDIEGFEIDALVGAAGILADQRPLVYMECHDPHKPRMQSFMTGAGYRLLKPMGRCYLWEPIG
jgi:FkbM family methyltransferase